MIKRGTESSKNICPPHFRADCVLSEKAKKDSGVNRFNEQAFTKPM